MFVILKLDSDRGAVIAGTSLRFRFRLRHRTHNRCRTNHHGRTNHHRRHRSAGSGVSE